MTGAPTSLAALICSMSAAINKDTSLFAFVNFWQASRILSKFLKTNHSFKKPTLPTFSSINFCVLCAKYIGEIFEVRLCRGLDVTEPYRFDPYHMSELFLVISGQYYGSVILRKHCIKLETIKSE